MNDLCCHKSLFNCVDMFTLRTTQKIIMPPSATDRCSGRIVFPGCPSVSAFVCPCIWMEKYNVLQ